MLSRAKYTALLAWHLMGQMKFPYRSIERIQREQSRRVRRMVAHAYRTTRYYRRTLDALGMAVDDFQDAQSLARLPLIERWQLQLNNDDFISNFEPREKFIHVRTGGSTGAPRHIYHSVGAVYENAAHAERERCMLFRSIGRRFGYRETIIASPHGTATLLQDTATNNAFLPKRLQIKRQYLRLVDPPEITVRLINEFKPDIIQSYGSYLTVLFSYLADSGVEFLRPKVISFSSDGISDAGRKLIQERFKIPLYSTYQANEGLKIGFECEEHLGLHINMDLYPTRVVDGEGRDLPPGEFGDVVISNLVNPAMPLLNYRLGDAAAFLPRKCPCGRNLPLLSFPPGRIDDWVELPSGRMLHPLGVRNIFWETEGIYEYQFIQNTPLDCMARVVAARDADRSMMEHSLQHKFHETFGREAILNVEFIDAIERCASGKFRPVLSLWLNRKAEANAS